MAVCDKLQADYAYNCLHPEIGGADEEMMIINHDDIDRTVGVNGFTFGLTEKLFIEGIAIKTGAKAYTVKGKRNPNVALFEPIMGDASSGFIHGAQFNIYEVDKDTVQMLNGLLNSSVMVILKTKQKNADGDNMYKVLGRVAGMYLETAPYNSNENQGTVTVNLKTMEEMQEPNAVEFLFDTNIATTDAIYQALKITVT